MYYCLYYLYCIIFWEKKEPRSALKLEHLTGKKAGLRPARQHFCWTHDRKCTSAGKDFSDEQPRAEFDRGKLMLVPRHQVMTVQIVKLCESLQVVKWHVITEL